MSASNCAESQGSKHDLDESPALGEIVQTASVTGVSTLVAQGLGYAVVLLLTVSLGADGFGVYSLVITVRGLATTVGLLGLGTTTLHYTAWYRGKGDITGVRKLLSAMTWGSLIWSTSVSVVLWLLSPALAQHVFNRPEIATALRIVVAMIPLNVLLNIWISGLHGLGLTIKRTFIEQVFLPVVQLGAVGIGSLIRADIEMMLFLTASASALATLLAGWQLLRAVPFWRSLPYPVPDWRNWAKFTIPTFLDALLVTSLGGSFETLLLGIFSTDAVVGIFSIVLRLMFIMKLPMTAFNTALAPRISETHAQKDAQQLGYLFRAATRWVVIVGAPLAAIFILFGRTMMSFFGAGFVSGAPALVIVAVGTLVSTCVGPVGHMLLMTGHSRIRLVNSLILLAIQLVLGFLLIPRWQLTGVAIVSAVSIATVSILGLAEVHALLKLHPFHIGMLKPLLACSFVTLLVGVLKCFTNQDSLWFMMILGVLFVGGYGHLLLKVSLIGEDKQLVRQWMKRSGLARICSF